MVMLSSIASLTVQMVSVLFSLESYRAE